MYYLCPLFAWSYATSCAPCMRIHYLNTLLHTLTHATTCAGALEYVADAQQHLALELPLSHTLRSLLAHTLPDAQQRLSCPRAALASLSLSLSLSLNVCLCLCQCQCQISCVCVSVCSVSFSVSVSLCLWVCLWVWVWAWVWVWVWVQRVAERARALKRA